MVVLDRIWLNLDWLVTAQIVIRFVNQWLNPLMVTRKFQKFVLTTFLSPSFLIQVWLGGSSAQTSLARSFMDKVKLQDLEKVLEPLFYHWKQKRQSKESFGNFTTRVVTFDLYTFCLHIEAFFLTLFLILEVIIVSHEYVCGQNDTIFCL